MKEVLNSLSWVSRLEISITQTGDRLPGQVFTLLNSKQRQIPEEYKSIAYIQLCELTAFL